MCGTGIMRASISASERRLHGGSLEMLSLEHVDPVVEASDLSVPERRRNVAVFRGLGLGLAGCGRRSSSGVLFARKQLICIVGVLVGRCRCIEYKERAGDQ